MTDHVHVTVDLSGTAATPSYDIFIGEHVLNQAGALIHEKLGHRRCVVVSDSNVASFYLSRLQSVLVEHGHVLLKTFVVPAGESSKSFSQLESLLNGVLAAGIDRKTLVIALGGGVVGDIAGLVASLAMRGVPFVQIPTTLLAQVDSAVGGKTAIDTAYGKNTIGTFFQPRLVLADVSVLDTLPERELRAGYAEVVKYGLISDRMFFDWCVANGRKIIARDHEATILAVRHACEAKAAIVAEDEHEAGIRAILNLGHTFGHALETSLDFGPALNHGEAVAIGTMMAFRFASNQGLCPEKDVEDVRAHFIDTGLPLKPPPFDFRIERLLSIMANDKKAEDGKISLVLPHGIGRAIVHKNIDAQRVCDLWKDVLES